MTDMPRSLDHLVLPTVSLAVARARLSALGFTVAPEGRHPFGTENACVYFSDGTFLEPLAVADTQEARAAVSRGNVFVSRDQAYRGSRGSEGFSAIVMATSDAHQDHEAFLREGISAGDMLDFSRPFTDAAGTTGTAAFRLAFAADLRAPDVFFFTCQRINAPKVDRAALQAQANGVTRIKGVVLSTREPSDYAGIASYLISGTTEKVVPISGGVGFAAANTTIEIVTSDEIASRFGLAQTNDAGLQAWAVRCGTDDLARLADLLAAAGIVHHDINGIIVVPPAPGQGAAFVFEENP